MNEIEKLALMSNGIDGDGLHISMNDQLVDSKKQDFNNSVQEYVDKFDKHNNALKEYAKSISENIEGLEIAPLYSYVLVKPFDENPFQQVRISESGIITDLGGMTPEYKSNETGQMEEAEQYIKVGTVIETGHKCEFVKTGDIVFYTVASKMPVPFFRQGFIVVNETKILAVVNEKLTERRNGFR